MVIQQKLNRNDRYHSAQKYADPMRRAPKQAHENRADIQSEEIPFKICIAISFLIPYILCRATINKDEYLVG